MILAITFFSVHDSCPGRLNAWLITGLYVCLLPALSPGLQIGKDVSSFEDCIIFAFSASLR